MYKVNRKRFEEIVDGAIAKIPRKFLEKLDNVVIVVEDKPNADQRKEFELRGDWTLFGLYEGIPQAERGDHYTNVLPDKITIFQRPIEEEAKDIADMKEIIGDTVWHEIAHHFGLDEKEVEKAEKRRNLK